MNFLAGSAIYLFYQVLHQQWNIFLALAQRRDIKLKNLEAKVEVFTELPPFNHLCKIDLETGAIEVKEMNTAHDCGTPINPMSVEGQLEGSVHMGLGYALSEQFIMKGGKTLTSTFLDYKIPCAEDMPPGKSVHIDTYEPEGPFGAKEAGEGLVSPTAPAIADAVCHATGYRCMDLPITPEKVLKGLGKL